MKTLGLDVGTNSIGWALVDDKAQKLIDAGVRIFPIGVQEDKYLKSGTELSKNAGRRIARSARRRYHRRKLRRYRLINLLKQAGLYPDPPLPIMSAFELFKLRKHALDYQVSLAEFGLLLMVLNKRRGFLSNRKIDIVTEEQEKEAGVVKESIEKLQIEIQRAGCRTVGEYFFSLFKATEQNPNWHNSDEPIERIRGRYVGREMYKTEFDLLWKAQQSHYPEVLTETLRKEIRDTCIFYQRPLKSNKHLISKCRFEPGKRVCPRSHWLFQEFRIWQTLNNLRISYMDHYKVPLTIDQKNRIFEILNTKKEMSVAEIRKLLALPVKTDFGDIGTKIKGNTTAAAFKEALGLDYELSWGILDDKDSGKHQIWHTLHFFDNEEKLIQYAQKTWNWDLDTAKKYAQIRLEPDYSNISLKAINKILPELRQGLDYAASCKKAGYHHSFDEEQEDKERITAEVISPLKNHEIKNPIVQQATSETIRLINSIIKKYGKPDTIRVELPRDLKKPKRIREQLTNTIRSKQQQREAYAEFLSRQFNRTIYPGDSLVLKYELWLEMGGENEDEISSFRRSANKIKSSDIDRYRLWLEADRISPYTGRVISFSRLFSSDIEIEHIVPYSRSLDDSFINKTIAEREFNKQKREMLPWEYFKNRPLNEWDAFKERVKLFPPAKRDRFMMKEIKDTFLSNQLNNTSYIALEVKRKALEVCTSVQISNGPATSKLRKLWGLNSILRTDNEDLKNRGDHRHHAIDAAVIACTTPYVIQLMSRHSQFSPEGRYENLFIKQPWSSFRADLDDKIQTIIVSYRKGKRLTTSKINKIANANSELLEQRVKGVRGALHDETLYGQIKHPLKSELVYVSRQPLSWFIENSKRVEKIIDPVVRKLVQQRIEQYGRDAFKEPLYMKTNRPGVKVIIQTVRVESQTKAMVQIRPNLISNQYVPTGNNYMMGIYRDEKGKQTHITVSLLEAVLRKMQNEPVLLNETEQGKLILAIQQKDMLLVFDNYYDEINWERKQEIFNKLYVVKKIDINGRIGLSKHYIADPDFKKISRPYFYSATASTLHAVKVEVSILGDIVHL